MLCGADLFDGQRSAAPTQSAWLTTRSVSADPIPESLRSCRRRRPAAARRAVQLDGGLRPGEVHGEQRRALHTGTRSVDRVEADAVGTCCRDEQFIGGVGVDHPLHGPGQGVAPGAHSYGRSIERSCAVRGPRTPRCARLDQRAQQTRRARTGLACHQGRDSQVHGAEQRAQASAPNSSTATA